MSVLWRRSLAVLGVLLGLGATGAQAADVPSCRARSAAFASASDVRPVRIAWAASERASLETYRLTVVERPLGAPAAECVLEVAPEPVPRPAHVYSVEIPTRVGTLVSVRLEAVTRTGHPFWLGERQIVVARSTLRGQRAADVPTLPVACHVFPVPGVSVPRGTLLAVPSSASSAILLDAPTPTSGVAPAHAPRGPPSAAVVRARAGAA